MPAKKCNAGSASLLASMSALSEIQKGFASMDNDSFIPDATREQMAQLGMDQVERIRATFGALTEDERSQGEVSAAEVSAVIRHFASQARVLEVRPSPTEGDDELMNGKKGFCDPPESLDRVHRCSSRGNGEDC